MKKCIWFDFDGTLIKRGTLDYIIELYGPRIIFKWFPQIVISFKYNSKRDAVKTSYSRFLTPFQRKYLGIYIFIKQSTRRIKEVYNIFSLARKKGYQLYVISSQHEDVVNSYLRPFRTIGFKIEIYCSSTERVNGEKEKAIVVQRLREKCDFIIGVGDSSNDALALLYSDIGFVINSTISKFFPVKKRNGRIYSVRSLRDVKKILENFL